MSDETPLSAARKLLRILAKERDRLDRIDDYVHGHHDAPYIPDSAGPEYKLLIPRSVCNWMPTVLNTPAQSLYVDNIHPGRKIEKGEDGQTAELPEWEHWQNSRLDSRQAAIYRAALTFGHSFTVTEMLDDGQVQTKGLSPRKTTALFEDPANDETPQWALTVTAAAHPEYNERGIARLWDETTEFEVTYRSVDDLESLTVTPLKPHGASTCPVTRFAALVDLDGRTIGVIEPLIPLQNRINQTIFDLLIVQTYGSFKVRTISGMAPPLKMITQVIDGINTLVPDRDDNGRTIPEDVQVNAMRVMYAKDPDTKFGTLDETPLDGYISAIEMAIQQLAAISQTPPHYVLGKIANLSAEALQAAETALSRKVQELRASFGESWERVFRLAAELDGNAGADDYKIETGWRDLEAQSMAKTADALLKLTTMGVPGRGLWPMIPGVTKTMLEEWDKLVEEQKAEDPTGALAAALNPLATSLASQPVQDDPATQTKTPDSTKPRERAGG